MKKINEPVQRAEKCKFKHTKGEGEKHVRKETRKENKVESLIGNKRTAKEEKETEKKQRTKNGKEGKGKGKGKEYSPGGRAGWKGYNSNLHGNGPCACTCTKMQVCLACSGRPKVRRSCLVLV